VTFGAPGLLVAALAVGSGAQESRALSEKVRGLLAAITYSNYEQTIRDLESLGPAALPTVAGEIAHLRGWALKAAAERVTAANHRPAAAIVARRLADPEHREDVMAALLAAGGRLGGDAEVPALTAVMKSPDHDEWTRLRAFLALMTIRSERSLAAALVALDGQRPARPRMPSAVAFADVVGRPVDEDARTRALDREDYAEWFRLGRGVGAAKVALGEGRTLMVFPDWWLGSGTDLWAEEFGADGRPQGSALFLGVALQGRLCPQECPIVAELRGAMLSIRRADTETVVTVDLAEARRDSDGDGFTDLVERRLSLDPRNPDSDGDGMADAADPVPNARTRPASTEAEEITAAIFNQVFTFTDLSGRASVFLGSPSQPLEGRKGPTLVIAPGEEERARARYAGWPFIRITPFEEGAAAPPGERRYLFVMYTGPLSGASYDVIVTRVAGRWLVRAVEGRAVW
jgi:hypothetical protein